MRRALTFAVTVVALAALATRAPAQDRTHVRDVRVGAHPGYDRVVIELDGQAEIAWERGPEPNEESFYIDADLGRRERTIRTKLAQVGNVSLKAMRVGTHVSLEPRERRVRAYLLAKPTRLVIDLAPAGPEEFAVPAGVTPLAPAKSIGSLKNAMIPEPEPKAEPEPAPEPEQPERPEHEPCCGAAEAPVTPPPPPSGEPHEGAVEGQHEPPPPEPAEVTPEPAPAPAPAPVPEPAAEVTAPLEATPGAEVTREPEPAPQQAEAPPPPEPPPTSAAPELQPAPAPSEDTGFPWLTALGALVVAAGVGALAWFALRREAEPILVRAPGAARAPLGAEGITREELRLAADTTGVIEQRLDEEVRARVALEERLMEASEELKVLRDRLTRVERKRDEAI